MNTSTYKDRNESSEQGLNSAAPVDSSINFVLTSKTNNKTRNTGELFERTNNGQTSEDKGSSIERGSYVDEDYIMQSRFDRIQANIN